jgi:hypothetical protein
MTVMRKPKVVRKPKTNAGQCQKARQCARHATTSLKRDAGKRKPAWLRPYPSGDTSRAHDENVDLLKAYLETIATDGRGLPANLLRPLTVSMRLAAMEAGLKLTVLARQRSECRRMVVAATNTIEIKARMKPRVRSDYTIDETIRIATAVVQAECELAERPHKEKCKAIETVLYKLARLRPAGLKQDAGEAISPVLSANGAAFCAPERSLLSEIESIRLRAACGGLELATFHGRLKLEAALRGFGMGALAQYTQAGTQTVINWAAGLKSPNRSLINDVPRLEKAVELPSGYLLDVVKCQRSGPSNVKQYHLPAEILAGSSYTKKEFRLLVDPTIDLRNMPRADVEALMAHTLTIFKNERDNDDIKRSKLRQDAYALVVLPQHLQDEMDSLVEQRTAVTIMGRIPSRKRGWDEDSEEIFRKKLKLFLGFLHKEKGVPLANLSIAYLAFPKAVRGYNHYLLDRKTAVGLQERLTEVARDIYVFAKSLTRERFAEEDRKSGGWLLDKQHLLEKMVPIDVVSRAKIDKAKRNWKKHLSKATAKLGNYHRELAGESTYLDSCKRVGTILKWKNPLDAIEFGAFGLADQIKNNVRLNGFRWATAIRASVVLKIHAQVPLRRKTFCGLTYFDDGSGMIKFENGDLWLEIPTKEFKNEKSKVFRDDYPNGIFRKKLVDLWGLYDDVRQYVVSARTIILSGVESPAFYVAQYNAGHVTPASFADNFRRITKTYIAYNPGLGTGIRGVKPFGSHAMRHIVATAVWKLTGKVEAAARAIHDTVKITEKHYKHYLIDLEEQSEILERLMQNSYWPKRGEILLPEFASPPSVPGASYPLLLEAATILAPKEPT